jgi:hypothetical protein
MAKGIPARGVLLYYGHLPVKETGAEVPTKGLMLNTRLDVRTADGQEGTVKQMVDGRTAWLMTEGMDVPLRVDPESGAPLEVDFDALAAELEGREEEADQAHREQSSVTYDLPKKEELRTAAELPGELKKAAGGVFKAWKDRKRGS